MYLLFLLVAFFAGYKYAKLTDVEKTSIKNNIEIFLSNLKEKVQKQK